VGLGYSLPKVLSAVKHTRISTNKIVEGRWQCLAEATCCLFGFGVFDELRDAEFPSQGTKSRLAAAMDDF
jgi:hypothetical protein